jgi:hypothetical protein
VSLAAVRITLKVPTTSSVEAGWAAASDGVTGVVPVSGVLGAVDDSELPDPQAANVSSEAVQVSRTRERREVCWNMTILV